MTNMNPAMDLTPPGFRTRACPYWNDSPYWYDEKTEAGVTFPTLAPRSTEASLVSTEYESSIGPLKRAIESQSAEANLLLEQAQPGRIVSAFLSWRLTDRAGAATPDFNVAFQSMR